MTCTAAMQHSNAAVRSSFKDTFRALGHDIIQLSRQHLSRSKVLPVSSTHYAAIHRRWSVIGLADFRGDGEGALPLAATALTDLPACILNHIASFVDTKARLPLFRTSKLLRDAILGHVAVDGGPQLTTCLRIQADIIPSLQQQKAAQDASSGEQASESLCHDNVHGLSAHAASRLLQLAAQSAHDVHLHARASLPASMTSQQMSCAIFDEDLGVCTSNSSRGIMSSYKAAHWLYGVLFRPGLFIRSHNLQCVTKLWLQDMALDHPMPQYIGCACPALKSYGLHNVVWPTRADGLRYRVWPHVEQLTLSDVCHPHLPALLTPKSLPSLSSMHVAWSWDYTQSQYTVHKFSTPGPTICARAFCDQLTELTLEGVAWGMVTPCLEVSDLRVVTRQNIHPVFTRLTSLSITHIPPCLRMTYNTVMLFLVECAPSLQKLHLGSLHLSRNYTHTQYEWLHMQHLRVDVFDTDMFPTLTCLPRMPQLQSIAVPKGSSTVHVEVGADWVVDVIKALTVPAAAESEGLPAALCGVVHICRLCVPIHAFTKKCQQACERLYDCLSAAAHKLKLRKR